MGKKVKIDGIEYEQLFVVQEGEGDGWHQEVLYRKSGAWFMWSSDTQDLLKAEDRKVYDWMSLHNVPISERAKYLPFEFMPNMPPAMAKALAEHGEYQITMSNGHVIGFTVAEIVNPEWVQVTHIAPDGHTSCMRISDISFIKEKQ